jgi:hypothetical protein
VAPGEGQVSPEQAAENYAEARGATRDYHSVYGDKTPTGQALKRGPFGSGYATQDSGVIPLYLKPGAQGAESIRNLVAAVGPQQAEAVIRDQAAASLMHAASRDGRIIVPRWRQWMDRYGGSLSAFPDLQRRFGQVAAAQAELDRAAEDYANRTAVHYRALEGALGTAAKQHEGFVSAFQKSALGDWLRADPDKAAAALFQGNDRVARAGQLAGALRNPWNAAPMEGLRRAVWDEFMHRVVPGYDQAAPPEASEMRFKPQRFQDVFRDNRAMLAKVLDPEQMHTLQGITDSLARDQLVMDRVRERVGSNTARDTRLRQILEGRPSIWGLALSGGLDAATTAAAAAAKGTGAAVTAHVGMRALAKIAGALRQAGIGAKNEMAARMYADPEFARLMFERYSPGGIRGLADRVTKALQRAPVRVLPQAGIARQDTP